MNGTVKNCIVGRGQVLQKVYMSIVLEILFPNYFLQVLPEGGSQESQTLLSKDRMMEV